MTNVSAAAADATSGLGRLARMGLQTLAAIGLTTALGIFTRVLIARNIGVTATGYYTLATLVPALLYVVGNLGMNVSAIHYIGNRRYPIDGVIGNIITYALAASLLMSALWIGGALFFPMYAPAGSDWRLLLATAASIPAIFVANSAVAILQGANRITQYNVLSSVSPALLALSLAVAFLAAGKLTYPVALVAWTVTNLVAAGLAVRLTRDVALWSLGFSFPLLRPLVSLGLIGYLANVGGFLVRRVDVFLLQVMAGPAAVGYYGVAFGLGELLWYVASSLGSVLSPAVAGASATSATTMTSAVCRHTLAIILALALGLWCVDAFLIRLGFGAAFLPAVSPLRWLLPGIVAGGVEKVLAADLIGRGKPSITLRSAWFALGINVAANLVLIPRWGASGAAMASSIAYIFAAGLTLFFYLRLSRTTLGNMLIISPGDVQAIRRLIDQRKRPKSQHLAVTKGQ